MSRCVIISACPVSPELAEALRPDDFIIACDAGYRNCAPLGRRPNIIVGDFDTAPCPEQQDDDIIVLPHVKDDTDTEYAAKLVSEKGFDEVLLLGGLGGRRVEHIRALNARLRTGLAQYPKVRINSPDTAVPQILNLSVQNVKGTVFQRELDARGVCVSVKSACSSDGLPSRAVFAVSHDRRNALSSWRISLSHLTTEQEITDFMQAFDACYNALTQ